MSGSPGGGCFVQRHLRSQHRVLRSARCVSNNVKVNAIPGQWKWAGLRSLPTLRSFRNPHPLPGFAMGPESRRVGTIQAAREGQIHRRGIINPGPGVGSTEKGGPLAGGVCGCGGDWAHGRRAGGCRNRDVFPSRFPANDSKWRSESSLDVRIQKRNSPLVGCDGPRIARLFDFSRPFLSTHGRAAISANRSAIRSLRAPNDRFRDSAIRHLGL